VKERLDQIDQRLSDQKK
jgi:phosphate uptake regulator